MIIPFRTAQKANMHLFHETAGGNRNRALEHTPRRKTLKALEI